MHYWNGLQWRTWWWCWLHCNSTLHVSSSVVAEGKSNRVVTSAHWQPWRKHHVSCLLPKPLCSVQTDLLFRAYVLRKWVFSEDQSLSENSRSALTSYQDARADHLEDTCVPLVLGNLRTEDHPTQPAVTLCHTPVLAARLWNITNHMFDPPPSYHHTSPESSNWLLIGYFGSQTTLIFHGHPTWDEWSIIIVRIVQARHLEH